MEGMKKLIVAPTDVPEDELPVDVQFVEGREKKATQLRSASGESIGR